MVGVSACAAALWAASRSSRSHGAADALRVPGLPGRGLRLEVLGHVALDVGVGARVAGLPIARRAGVVDVVGGLLPGVEHDLLVGVIRVQRGDDALGRVVEQHRADADRDAELEADRAVGRAEEGLVLADRLALVVEDGPAAAHPARADLGAAFDQRPRLGLDLLLDLAAKAVGVGEAELDLQPCGGSGSLDVGFAGERRGAGGCHCVGSSGWACRVRRKRSRS